MKKCSKCKEHKPRTDEFWNRDGTKPDGLYSSCKNCKIKSTKSKRAVKKRRLRDKRKYRNTKHKHEARKAAREKYGFATSYECAVLNCMKLADNLHHVSYEHPLDVVPLCRKHHNFEHSRGT